MQSWFIGNLPTHFIFVDDRVGSLLVTVGVVPNSPAGGAGDGGGQQAQCQEFVHTGPEAGAGGGSEDFMLYDNNSARVNYLFG